MSTEQNESPRLLILGAHPDDAEYHAGGLATIYRQLGRPVKFVSITDGSAGHHQMGPSELAARRKQEANNAAALIGAECEVWSFHDGRLQPTLQLREQIITEIRTYKPDLVLTHRPCDYHPDHRAVATAVQDASYMVTVPLICHEVPFLKQDPVVAYMVDLFQKPSPLQADVIIDISTHLDQIVRMLACHESQFFEFLPFNHRVTEPVPSDKVQRLEWLREWYISLIVPRNQHFAKQIAEQCGPEVTSQTALVEAYEISEYARKLNRELRTLLFPTISSGDLS